MLVSWAGVSAVTKGVRVGEVQLRGQGVEGGVGGRKHRQVTSHTHGGGPFY